MLSLLLITALAVQYPSTSKPAADTASHSRQPATSRATTAAARDTSRAAAVGRLAFHDSMRELWEDHVVYTRNFIISAAAGLPDTAAVAERLMRNQDEIGAAIRPYYGDAAGTQLATLLRNHIQLAGRVVAAARGTSHAMQAGYGVQGSSISTSHMMPSRSGDTTTMRSTDTAQIKLNSQYPTADGRSQPDTTKSRSAMSQYPNTAVQSSGAQNTDSTSLNAAIAALRANGDSIAIFLSSANPRGWSRSTLQGAFQMHVNLLLQEATTRLKGDWAGNIAAFDEGEHQALQMADMLSDGIIKQFPSRFSTKATTMSSLQ
jgi:hypothetical protein